MKDQEEAENMEEPRIDKPSIREDRKIRKDAWRKKSQCTIFWTVWELNIRG